MIEQNNNKTKPLYNNVAVIKNQFTHKPFLKFSQQFSLANAKNNPNSIKDIFNLRIPPNLNEIKHSNTSQNFSPNYFRTPKNHSNTNLHLSTKRSVSPNVKEEISSLMGNNALDGSSQHNCISPNAESINNNTNDIMNNIVRRNRRRGITIKGVPATSTTNNEKKFLLTKTFSKTITRENIQFNQSYLVKLKQIIKNIIESDIEAGIMAALFLVGLFLSDIKTIYFGIKYDTIFDLIYLFLAVILFTEVICSTILITGYLYSFFFWLDIFSVISLLTDLEQIKKRIIFLFLTKEEEEKATNPQIERIIIIFRMLTIIKLIRIVKIYKAVIALSKSYEIRKKLEEMRQKEIEKIKNKERKSTFLSIKKKRTNNALPQINNFVNSFAGASMLANNSNTNLNVTSLFQEHKNRFHKSFATINSIYTLNNVSENNNTLNNNGNSTTNQASSNFAAEAALRKMIANRQKERKKSLQMESKTKITKVLFLNITQKILIIILFLFFISPLIDKDFYGKDKSNNYQLLSNFFEAHMSKTQETSLQNNKYVKSHVDFPILYILYNNITLFTNSSISTDLNNYRFWEYHITYSFRRKISIIYSSKRNRIITSYINIIQTISTLVIMFYLSVLINTDLDSLILKPLEIMLEIVQAVAKDPVNYKSIEEMNKHMIKNEAQTKKGIIKHIDTEALSVDYEIKTLQFAILRISALIAIGFGEAGGEILKENINSEHGLNPMIPGKKIQSVFGFCFIKNFTEINEVLQERTILFVNTIADIVHSSVDKFQGVCNKNIGDCFLLVWKFNNSFFNDNNDTTPVNVKRSQSNIDRDESRASIQQIRQRNENDVIDKCKSNPNMQLIADSALVSFLCIIKKIRKSQSILSLNKDKQLEERFGKNFKIQMGFGLHIGWGIEGAIGSFYKIDCSYLSPNVNTAARLETATNIYGVDILFSGDLYNCFSLYTQKLCRQIDTVALKGCLFPVKLYTVDLNPSIRPGKLKKKILSGKEKRKMINIKRAKFKSMFERAQEIGEPKSITEIYYKISKGFRMLLGDVKSECFKKYFKLGFDEYVRGNWELAYKYLKQANYIEPTDSPTVKLCNFVFAHGKKAPLDWKGFRKLDSKF